MGKQKREDPLLVALAENRSYTWTQADGGDLASMRGVIKHGQTLTMSPIAQPQEIRVGDIVLVKWHNGYINHLVGEIQGNRFLIVNAVGKVNGWVDGSDIMGRVTQIIEPLPRPSVPDMIEQLAAAYDQVVTRQSGIAADKERFASIIADLRWYAERIGEERWDQQPRSNIWSLAQNLWKLTKQASTISDAGSDELINTLIDQGKRCVGLAAEIIIRFTENQHN